MLNFVATLPNQTFVAIRANNLPCNGPALKLLTADECECVCVRGETTILARVGVHDELHEFFSVRQARYPGARPTLSQCSNHFWVSNLNPFREDLALFAEAPRLPPRRHTRHEASIRRESPCEKRNDCRS